MSYNRDPCLGDPGGVDQAPAVDGHRSPCLNHSHLDVSSAVWVMMALLICSTFTSILSALIKDWLTNPLHPTSMGLYLVLHPLLWHLPSSSTYLALFLSKASSTCSSQRTVSAGPLASLFQTPELCLAWGSNNVIWCSCGFSSAPTKAVDCVVGCGCLLEEIPVPMTSAMTCSTWSLRQR